MEGLSHLVPRSTLNVRGFVIRVFDLQGNLLNAYRMHIMLGILGLGKWYVHDHEMGRQFVRDMIGIAQGTTILKGREIIVGLWCNLEELPNRYVEFFPLYNPDKVVCFSDIGIKDPEYIGPEGDVELVLNPSFDYDSDLVNAGIRKAYDFAIENLDVYEDGPYPWLGLEL